MIFDIFFVGRVSPVANTLGDELKQLKELRDRADKAYGAFLESVEKALKKSL